jgi:DNA replication initiation complex subunit (GINS family)
MIEALRIIAAKSPYAGAQAMQCIRAVQVKSPVVRERYNRVVEMAFGDSQAEFTPEERQLIASYVDADTGKTESRTDMMRFRVTPSEKREIEALAAATGKDISEYLRALVWPE